MKLSDVLSALKTLAGVDPKDLASLAQDPKTDPQIVKALKDLKSTDLTDGQLMNDLWANGHMNAVPNKEEVKTGPSQESSGAGAEKMIAEYASPAAQMGIQLTAEKFIRALAPIHSSMKAVSDGVAALLESQTKLPAQLAAALKAKKAEDGEDGEDDEEEEESEVVEINASKKAKDILRKARSLMRKIDALKAEMEEAEEDDDKDAKKAARKSCKAITAELGSLLPKALIFAYAANNLELKKSIRTIAAKADINVVQEEEEEEEEEDEEEKAKKAAAAKAIADAAAVEAAAKAAAEKAKTDDKGNQADRKDPANGNQAAASKAELDDIKQKLEKALHGDAVLSMKMNELFDVLSGKSRIADRIPDLSKAKPEEMDGITEVIEDLEDGGQLTVSDANAARRIASLVKSAALGQIPYSNVTDSLEKTSNTVVELFKARGVKAAA